jgi:hypothetical protein
LCAHVRSIYEREFYDTAKTLENPTVIVPNAK